MNVSPLEDYVELMKRTRGDKGNTFTTPEKQFAWFHNRFNLLKATKEEILVSLWNSHDMYVGTISYVGTRWAKGEVQLHGYDKDEKIPFTIDYASVLSKDITVLTAKDGRDFMKGAGDFDGLQAQ